MAGALLTRIIAGRWGGRRIDVPKGRTTRPTTDRVREALFSALDAWGLRDGAAVLDLYAGSGALGLEAASRGAAEVLLVEADRRVAAVAQANVRALGAPATVRTGPVERVLAEPRATPFDLVLADPPYDLAEDVLAGVLAALVAHGWLADDGLVVVERSTRSPAPTWPAALSDGWSRRYGETTLHYRTYLISQ